MSPAARKPRRKPANRRKSRGAASSRHFDAMPGSLQQWILDLGRTLVGILPRARRIRAANDPHA